MLYDYVIQTQRYELINDVFNSDLVKKINYQTYLREYALFFLVKILFLLQQKNETAENSLKWQIDQEYRFFMYRLATNEKGLLQLLQTDNRFVLENIGTVLNQDYFYYTNGHQQLLLTLYEKGFKENIKNNILWLNEEILAFLFQDLERKQFLIYANFLYTKCDHFEYFLDLKDDLKFAVGYYMRHYSQFFEDDKLKIIFANNFQDILDIKTQEFLMSLYSKVKRETIIFAINLALKYPNSLLEKINYLAQEYFSDEIKTLLFWERYPHLMEQLLQEKKDKLKIWQVYSYLIKNPAILNIKNWDDDLATLTVDVEGQTCQKYIMSLSPQGEKKTVLFNNEREIIIIKENGEPIFLEVLDAHYKTLCEYYGYGNKERNYKPILYQANKAGDIVLVIENEAIMLWLPKFLTSLQQEMLLQLDMLSVRKRFTEKSAFYPNIVSDTEEQYYYFNGEEALKWDEYLTFIQHMPIQRKR